MQEVADRPTPQLQGTGYALFAVLLFVDSFHYIFARMLLPHLHPTVSAFFVLLVAAVELGIYGGVRRQLHWHTLRTHFWFFAAIGFLIAASTVLSYLSIAYIDPGTASMLAKTGIVFSLILSVIWLHERLTQRQLLGAALAVVGAFIISLQPGTVALWGSLILLASTLMYSLHTALVKRWGGEMVFIDFFFFRVAMTAAFLLIFAVGGGHLVVPDGSTFLLLLVVGSVDVVLSRGIYYFTLRIFPLSVHTIILTLSPVVAIVFALFLFGTFPGFQELIGGVAVLAGVYIVTRSG